MASVLESVPLGSTGLQVSRIGLGSSYGIGAREVEAAYERGINYLYWGSIQCSVLETTIYRHVSVVTQATEK
ncbi:hypothetical protein [Chloracidobacterium aggregatum]|uniref:Uncharacterized protein n=1 Tax=Chloracidobacterium sp. N TaxID=2821540 RepID=A0ABX8AZS5_9BACT|nr:hypothetical protein [Chloracidobacterium aggregatum]QUV85496.1 hypothetical protein J8C03_04295 [Chloracidobacterium sp. 2]QUV88100.1 hypothetical protein J8C07_01825 [Chloracidobacterium sp. S]QUV91023.1 hypothetical protein J8C04_00995 [Chloracidobacterium sp. A]QUV94210.1 hypothetical protein J8C05_01780 [Chloracidobacterium sp. N]QUV97409.1 hypothetical protein J8C00_02835 [Chloracidobacterium sp. E]